MGNFGSMFTLCFTGRILNGFFKYIRDFKESFSGKQSTHVTSKNLNTKL